MDTMLQGRVALVTGATSGIGRATALGFGGEGAHVAVTYHANEAGAHETAAQVRELGVECSVHRYALEEPESAEALVRAVLERHGSLGVLVHNAVRWPEHFAPTEEVTLADWRSCVHANVDGAFALLRAVIAPMRAGGFGRIVSISTGLVQDGLAGSGPYVASKGALHALHRTLAKELGPEGILCNVVMSGTVDNQRPRPEWMRQAMARSASTGRMTLADEVARTAVFLGSGANGHVHGEAVRADGFFVSPHRMEPPPSG